MRLCPHGLKRADKTISIPETQKDLCIFYEESKYNSPYCWRYRKDLDHCNKIEIPREPE